MDKAAVITGAGSGLGAALARRYASLGYHVILLGRRKEKLEQTAKTLTSSYSIYEVDVSSNKDVQAVFAKINEEVHQSIDVLVNNAGVGMFDLAEKIEEQHVHQMIDINLKGTIFCTQAVLGEMKSRGEGTIVNIISTAGQQGKVNESVYCASKFGVRGFTESLLLELKDTGVRIFAAYMGGMKTEFWDGIYTEEEMKHLMDPEDVADIIMENIRSRAHLAVTEVTIKNR